MLATDKNQNNILDLCKKSQKGIVLMPAGQQSRYFHHYLKKHSINVDYFVDNDETKHGSSIENIPVLSFSEFKVMNGEKLIIIATNEHIETAIVRQLESNDVKNHISIIADYICYSPEEIDNPRELINKNFEEYCRLYNLLEDKLSRKTLVNKLNYLITYNKKYLEEVVRPVKNQYFEPEIYRISSEDYFVDGGAFDGDTLEQLLVNTDFKIAGYWGFEPDDTNFTKLKEKVRGYNNIQIFRKGLFKEETVVRFDSANKSVSHISDNGTAEVEVVPLDIVLRGEKVSFIKMDIEGAEYEALLGARNLIVTQKPCLAISVYHKFDDIYKLAFLIESFGVKYKYYLRHYSIASAETILYAK
ncbi:MAG: FkbM family methyltransferase [Candidatus Xenobiia bacterium LiM19]